MRPKRSDAQAQRMANCELTDHEFVNENRLFPPRAGDSYNPQTVTYRMICKQCGAYSINPIEVDLENDDSPTLSIPIYEGPEGRMHEFWRSQEKIRENVQQANNTNRRMFNPNNDQNPENENGR